MTKTKNSETKKRILDSAKEEFAECGYDGARMGSIAKRANANQALLHYYFDSKEQLYKEVLRQYFSVDDEKLIRDRVEQWDLTIEQELYMGIYLLVHFPLEALGSEFTRMLTREVAEGREQLKNIMIEYVLPKLISFQTVIQNGIDKGIFETCNPYMVVMQLIVFIISFENIKNIPVEKGSPISWGSIISSGGDKDEVFKFLLEHTFKGLTPAGNVVEIPDFSQEHIQALDLLISDIAKMR